MVGRKISEKKEISSHLKPSSCSKSSIKDNCVKAKAEKEFVLLSPFSLLSHEHEFCWVELVSCSFVCGAATSFQKKKRAKKKLASNSSRWYSFHPLFFSPIYFFTSIHAYHYEHQLFYVCVLNQKKKKKERMKICVRCFLIYFDIF